MAKKNRSPWFALLSITNSLGEKTNNINGNRNIQDSQNIEQSEHSHEKTNPSFFIDYLIRKLEMKEEELKTDAEKIIDLTKKKAQIEIKLALAEKELNELKKKRQKPKPKQSPKSENGNGAAKEGAQ